MLSPSHLSYSPSPPSCLPKEFFQGELLGRGRREGSRSWGRGVAVLVSDLLVHHCPICWGWCVWLKQGSLLLLAPPINHNDKSQKGNILPGKRTGRDINFTVVPFSLPPQTSRAVLVEVQTAKEEVKGREDVAVLLGFEGAARALGIGKGAGLQLERLVRVSRSLLMSFFSSLFQVKYGRF